MIDKLEAIKQIEAFGKCKLHSSVTQDEDFDGWLKARTNGIGGSDIAAICGKSPYKSPRDIYLSKTMLVEGDKQSEAARWGNVLEQTIAAEWAQRFNRKYVYVPYSFKSLEFSYMNANIDGFTLDADDNIDGLLEIKTTSAFNKDVWETGPLPEYYLYQIQWYMMVTGIPKATIVCLVGGQALFEYEFIVSDTVVQDMKTSAAFFWNNYVLKLVEPPLTDVDSDKVGVGETIPTDNPLEPFIIENTEYEKMIEMYLDLNKKLTEMEKIKKAIYNNLFEGLQHHEEAVTSQRTLKVQKQMRRNCDMDTLKALYPAAYGATISVKEIQILKIK